MFRRRLFIPEVVQTSMMDCGPATLKAMLEGWGIPVSYGRLREACQTDVDGTSIDTLEEVGAQLGLTTEQIMLPVDHVLVAAARTLPAIIVVRHPSGVTHFLVVWRKHGRFLQLMDPATGRRWVTARSFLNELYVHSLAVPAADWREWAGSAAFLEPLQQRLAELKLSRSAQARVLSTALEDSSWRSLAALDASTRLVRSLISSGGVKAGNQARRLLEAFFRNSQHSDVEGALAMPAAYWSVRPNGLTGDGESLLLRGAVLVRVTNAQVRRSGAIAKDTAAPSGAPPLSAELTAALEERPAQPIRELMRLFLADGSLGPIALLMALGLAAGGVVIEALLLRGLFDVGRELMLSGQRFAAFSALVVFMLALVSLDIPIVATALSLGRRLEVRLRIAFLEKLPRLSDRYFHSRLTSDMAERSQSIHRIRLLPELGSQLVRAVLTLILITTAIILLNPPSLPLVVVATAFAVIIPVIGNRVLSERDLRVRSHSAALSRFYMDALQGLVTIRTHSSEKVVRREQEGLLVEWVRSGRALQRGVVVIEGLQSFFGFGLAALICHNYLKGEGQVAGGILIVFWALSQPLLGQEIALLTRLYPVYRNITLRLFEPLGAIEEEDPIPHQDSDAEIQTDQSPALPCGVHITLREVDVHAAGHSILQKLNLVIEPGTHLAIVGPSGAGKSSLVGLLLGWHKPATGIVMVDHLPLEGHYLDDLRRHTAWIDPSVQLWNRPLLENLRYGAARDSLGSISAVVEAADLGGVLERLPDGLQTTLGEGGALVSGGEGQRVRLGRAMLRAGVRLVILDEPFRGLERNRRRELLSQARKFWQRTTLICITHDIFETLSFGRVLVVDNGQIVEDGIPNQLSKQPHSFYRRLLDAEESVRKGLWADAAWRRVRLDNGRLSEADGKVKHA